MTPTPDEMARKAAQLLADDFVQAVLTSIESRYIHEWRNTSPQDVQKREAAHAAIRAIDDFRAKLKALASAPKVDAHNGRSANKR
jgi:ribonuclease HI